MERFINHKETLYNMHEWAGGYRVSDKINKARWKLVGNSEAEIVESFDNNFGKKKVTRKVVG